MSDDKIKDFQEERSRRKFERLLAEARKKKNFPVINTSKAAVHFAGFMEGSKQDDPQDTDFLQIVALNTGNRYRCMGALALNRKQWGAFKAAGDKLLGIK